MTGKMKRMVAEKSPRRMGRPRKGADSTISYVRLSAKERSAADKLARERGVSFSDAFKAFYRLGARTAGYLEREELELGL